MNLRFFSVLRPSSYRRLPLVALACCIAAGCGPADEPEIHVLRGGTMGTQYSVQLVATNPDAGLAADIGARLERIETLMSTYRDDSIVSRFNASPRTEWFTVPKALCDVVAEAIEISHQSGGAFDITLSPLVDLWGFGPGGGGGQPPSEDRIDALLDATGYDKLDTDCSVPAVRKADASLRIDLSAIAKGRGVDDVAELLDARGITDYLIEIGGEVRARGQKPAGERWRIAVEAPLYEERRIVTSFALDNSAVATSGDYRNFFESDGRYYSHLLDPRTGAPVEHGTAAVTVVADTATRADALATALLIMGKADGYALAERENIAALFVERIDGDIVAEPTSRFSDLSSP